jgi:hypothetical protein
MPAYYAMGYLSRGLDEIMAIGEHPHAKTPNNNFNLNETAEKSGVGNDLDHRPS